MENYIKKKFKIGFDISKMHPASRKRGIGFYAENLISALREYTDVEVNINEEDSNLQDTDLVHYPYFDLFLHTLPFLKYLPTVVTIHDVTPLIFPKQYPVGIRGKLSFLLQKLSLGGVKAIITDSVSSKNDIHKLLGIDDHKIFAIYLAPKTIYQPINDKSKLSKIKNMYNLPDRFSLYVGDVNWNKNLINLTQASLDAELDIVLVGNGFTQRDNLNHLELVHFKNFLEKFESNNRVHMLGFIPEDDLVHIYNLADLLLMPSYYEGFGLPILEAQACGTPVITGNVSSMPEVAGNGALFVDPYQVSEIEKAIRSIWDDASLRLNLIQNGFENVSQFSWKKTAQETVKVYYHVLR